MSRKLNRSVRDSGFTIVELMITVLILAILIAIVTMTMTISKSKAHQSACKANLRTLFESVVQYQCLHEGNFPPNLDVLITETYLKPSFKFKCPGGDYGTLSGDYRDYYSSITGHTSCPRADHNP